MSAKLVLAFLAASSVGGCSPSQSATTVMSDQTQTAVTLSGGADWSSFRGPNGNGFSSENGINTAWASKPPRVIWRQPLHDHGYAGPAVANGVVFLMDHQGSDSVICAWRQTDGKPLWTHTIPDDASENEGFTRSTPTIFGGKVYVLSRMGKALCLDAASGGQVWEKDLVAEYQGEVPTWLYSASPVIDGNRVIFTAGAPDGALVGLDLKTGARVFKGGSGPVSYATPVIATIGGVKQYVSFLAKKVCGIDAATGRELWSFPWETAYDVNAATPLVIGNSVFITSGYGHGCAMIDIHGNATLRWKNRAMQAHFSSPIFDGHAIYGDTDPGNLVCLDPATGRTLWNQPGFEKGGLIGIDGMILAMDGSNGELILARLQPSGYQELGRVAPLRGRAWTAPIVSNKTAVIRTQDAIAVLDLR